MTDTALQTEGFEQGQHLILYDGLCALCNRSVQFVLRRDSRHLFDFASIQGAIGRAVLERLGQYIESTSTFYVVTNYRSPSPALLSKARAVLLVLQALDVVGPWSFLGRRFPVFFLDFAYDVIARNRYRICGRVESCWLPNSAFTNRFLDGEGMGGPQ